jgi:hypothetical protein
MRQFRSSHRGCRLVWAAASSVLAAAACEDGSTRTGMEDGAPADVSSDVPVGGGGATSGLPADKNISDLDEAEAMQFCEYAQRVRAQAIASVSDPRITCLYQVLLAPGVLTNGTIDAMACEQARDSCLRATSAPPPAADVWSCTAQQLAPSWTTCSLPVGVVEGCLNAVMAGARAKFDALVTKLSCSYLSQAAGGDGGATAPVSTQPDETAECSTVLEQCPTLATGPFD